MQSPLSCSASTIPGRSVEEATAAALEWLRRCKTEGSACVAEKEPTVQYLRPNMGWTLDKPWHHAKREIAAAQQELTQLWHVGPRLRNLAIAGEVPNGAGGFHP